MRPTEYTIANRILKFWHNGYFESPNLPKTPEPSMLPHSQSYPTYRFCCSALSQALVAGNTPVHGSVSVYSFTSPWSLRLTTKNELTPRSNALPFLLTRTQRRYTTGSPFASAHAKHITAVFTQFNIKGHCREGLYHREIAMYSVPYSGV